MDNLDNPQLRQQVLDFLSAQGDEAMTWCEVHGLLCALATGPVKNENWQALIADEQPVPESVIAVLNKLRERLASRLAAGESISLPCRLDPEEDNDGDDLCGWCAGFMAGVLLDQDAWHRIDEEAIANLLLPILLVSGLDDDPQMDALWDNEQLVRQMAFSIPEVLEEIFLHFNAPDMPDED